MGKTAKKIAIGTIMAAAIGYVAGILTAPKSGKETRKDIKNTALKAKKEAEKKLKTLHSELTILIDKAKKKVKIAKASTKIHLSQAIKKGKNAKEKAREMLSALHEGDANDADLDDAVKEVNKAVEDLKKYLSKTDTKKNTKQ